MSVHGYALGALAALSLVVDPAGVHAAIVPGADPAPARVLVQAGSEQLAEAPRALPRGNARQVALPDHRAASTTRLLTPKGPRLVRTAGLRMPATARLAYLRAEAILDEVAPACGLSWTMLAAVGRVESDHGRYGGARLSSDGASSPRILGVPLNGVDQVSKVPDTDNGRLDGNKAWDRAVGPMQFLPTTWSVVGVDGDGDGRRSADDIHDAAVGAAVFICAAGDSVEDPAGMRSAFRGFNDSRSYVALVMSFERRYRAGDFDTDSSPRSYGTAEAPQLTTNRPLRLETLDAVAAVEPEPDKDAKNSTSKRQPAAGTTGQAGRAADSAKPRRADQTRTPDPPSHPPSTGGPGAGTTDQPAPTPEPKPEPKPKPAVVEPQAPSKAPAQEPDNKAPSAEPTPGSSTDPEPQPNPDQNASPTPDLKPNPEPEPEPSPEPSPEPKPEPSPEPAPAPEPEPDLVLTEVTGLFTECDEGFCLDEEPVSFGDFDLTTLPAPGDLDADGAVADMATELASLHSTEVTLLVDTSPATWVVHGVNGIAYLRADGTPAPPSTDANS